MENSSQTTLNNILSCMFNSSLTCDGQYQVNYAEWIITIFPFFMFSTDTGRIKMSQWAGFKKEELYPCCVSSDLQNLEHIQGRNVG